MFPALRFIFLFTGWLVMSSIAFGQSTLVYEGPVPIKLKSGTAVLPVTIVAEPGDAGEAELLLHAYSSTHDMRPILHDQMQKVAREKANACELRVAVPQADLNIRDGLIVLAAIIQSEFWICTSFIKTRLGSDSTRITASAIPGVRNGRLFLEPGSLQVEGIGDLIGAIGGEQVLRNLYQEAIDRFNNSPDMTRLPDALIEAGFAYHSVALAPPGSDPASVRVSIVGPNDLINLIRIIAGIR